MLSRLLSHDLPRNKLLAFILLAIVNLVRRGSVR